MPEPLFHAPRERGSAIDQLRALRDLTRRAPGGEPVAGTPVEGFAAAAEPGAVQIADGAGAPATAFVDDAAAHAGVLGNDPDALQRAAQSAATAGVADPAYSGAARQVVDVQIQPRLIIQGQQGAVVVPVDVPVPAAEPRVVIAAPTAVVVDPATGAAVPQARQAAAVAPEGAAVAASPRAGFRNMSAQQIGDLFRRGASSPAAGAAAAAPAVDAAMGAARPSLVEQLRAAASGLRGAPAAAPPAAAAGEVAERATGLAERAVAALRVASKVSPRG